MKNRNQHRSRHWIFIGQMSLIVLIGMIAVGACGPETTIEEPVVEIAHSQGTEFYRDGEWWYFLVICSIKDVNIISLITLHQGKANKSLLPYQAVLLDSQMTQLSPSEVFVGERHVAVGQAVAFRILKLKIMELHWEGTSAEAQYSFRFPSGATLPTKFMFPDRGATDWLPTQILTPLSKSWVPGATPSD